MSFNPVVASLRSPYHFMSQKSSGGVLTSKCGNFSVSFGRGNKSEAFRALTSLSTSRTLPGAELIFQRGEDGSTVAHITIDRCR